MIKSMTATRRSKLAAKPSTPQVAAKEAAEMSMSELQTEYANRGYTITEAGGRYIIAAKGQGATQEQLKLFSRGRVNDIDGAISELKRQRAENEASETLHARMSGLAFHEMSFAEWQAWEKIHKDASSLLDKAQKELFPSANRSDLRRKAASHPNLLQGYIHEAAVEAARDSGKPIPAAVQAEYPELFKIDETTNL